MRKLTEKEIENLDASALAEYFRQEARQEIAQKKQDAANAEKFAAIALPYIREGQDFDGFMSLTGAPSSFRSRYERLQTEYRAEHRKSPEEVELQKLESEVAAAMGIADPPEQAKPTAYEGADYVSAVAWAEQVRKNRERQRRFVGGTASEQQPEPEPEPEPEPQPEPEEPDDDDDSAEPDTPTEDTPAEPSDPAEDDPAEDNPTSPEDSTEPEHGEPSDNA